MNDEDFDIQQFAKLFDAALASDNPSVKKALRNFMMVAAIVDAEDVDRKPGPFQQVLDQVIELEKRLAKVERNSLANDYAKQMAKEMSKKYHWDQYTTTWPSTYITDTTSTYPSHKEGKLDLDYIEQLIGKGKL